MSTLRSALDELQAEDLCFAGNDELEADFAELERAADLLLTERARRLAEIDRARTAGTGTCRSLRGWPCGFGWPSPAAGQVLVARALEETPATRHALRESEITRSAVRVLVGARDGHPGGFAHSEATLVDAARTLSVRELPRRTSSDLLQWLSARY